MERTERAKQFISNIEPKALDWFSGLHPTALVMVKMRLFWFFCVLNSLV